jgi:hypothetical protein
MGIGADLGAQYVKHVGKDLKIFAGASITDVGNTKFSDPHAESIPMNISVGVGGEQRLEVGKLKFDFDMRNMSQTTAFVNMTHLGVEYSMGLLAFDAGLNQMDPTFGVSFDIWVLKVYVTSYAEEYGYAFHQDPSRKYLISVDFNLPI